MKPAVHKLQANEGVGKWVAQLVGVEQTIVIDWVVYRDGPSMEWVQRF